MCSLKQFSIRVSQGRTYWAGQLLRHGGVGANGLCLASMVSSVRAGHAWQVHSRVEASKAALISVCLDVVGVRYQRGL